MGVPRKFATFTSERGKTVNISESQSPLLDVADVAELLRCSKRHVRKLQGDGQLPTPLRLGKKLVRFRRSDIERWLAADEPREVSR